jgi:putative transposase
MGKKPHNRRSIRVQGFDYTRAGAYFVTICAWKRWCIFGDNADGAIALMRKREIVAEEWLNTAIIRPYVAIDEFTVMPNHFHGILWLLRDEQGTARRAPTREGFGKPVTGSLPTIIAAFKAAVTRRINALRISGKGEVWQRGYYEHVIRDDESLNRIREYIIKNPCSWELDKENIHRKRDNEFYQWLENIKARPGKSACLTFEGR